MKQGETSAPCDEPATSQALNGCWNSSPSTSSGNQITRKMGGKAFLHVLDHAPRGQPIDPTMLRELDVSPALASYWVRAGWLVRLAKGAYLVRGDTPTREGILRYLSRRVPGLHVGGKTALDWQGARHNIAFRPRIVLWGQVPYRFPTWVPEYVPYSYQTTQLFTEAFPYETGLKPLPNGSSQVLVSVPERALLELVSDVGKGQSLEEVINIAQTLRNLRVQVLDQFLEACQRVKVVRLVRDIGLATGFTWGQGLQKHVDRLSADKRWSNRTHNGSE